MTISMLAKTGNAVGNVFGCLSVQTILIRLWREVIVSMAMDMMDKKISKAIEGAATKRK